MINERACVRDRKTSSRSRLQRQPACWLRCTYCDGATPPPQKFHASWGKSSESGISIDQPHWDSDQVNPIQKLVAVLDGWSIMSLRLGRSAKLWN